MPKRTDLKRVLLIGSGPIVIGQAAEFDYSGTQAVKALKEEGFEVVLVNSNPATIMTDPEIANRTYVEPLTKEYLEPILAAERPAHSGDLHQIDRRRKSETERHFVPGQSIAAPKPQQAPPAPSQADEDEHRNRRAAQRQQPGQTRV